MVGLLIVPNYMPALDLDGNPIPGARLYAYQNETTTPTTVYTDAALSVPAPNPIIADASGVFPLLFFDPTTPITVAVTDALGAPLAAYDNVNATQYLIGSPSQVAALAQLLIATGAFLPAAAG